jgi:branched-chain amino acid transport system substrate-binding protein
MRKLPLAVVALAIALAVGLTGAWGRGSADPGVTSSSILLGGTTPLSGIASGYASVARGAEAYFKFVNANGGVNGRQITFTYLDDAYNPSQTVQATRQLVEQDKVFADYDSLGTEQNLAIRDYLAQRGVPQVFVASGARVFGADYQKYPGTIGFQPTYAAEGYIYGRYIRATKPKAKIAVLYQNDDYGKELLAGLKGGLAPLGKAIVSTQGYEATATDVSSQISSLKGSGANTLMIFATPAATIQTYVSVNKLGWKPQIFVNAVSSASQLMRISAASSSNATLEGSLSIVFLKDPTSPKWKNDPTMKLYRSILAKYGSGGNPNDVFNVYAMASAWTMVDALKRAGKNLTRTGLLKAVTSLNEPKNPFVLPGITIKTTPTSRFPISQAQMQRWHNGAWQSFGPLLSAKS